MKVLDLFSGIGGFSLAAHRAGMEVIAHCEIEPFPQAVLAYRFPNIPIFNDVRKITKESFYERTGQSTVDVVVGGSPCQDLSVAGKQRGLDGNRSGLFFEQMRVARELGAKWIVWENVPGALSSNKGADFARIISEFTGWDIGSCKLGGAGYFRNRTEKDYSVVYRIFDTQFFRVPQRRRRIYLVGRLGRDCPPEILFERESLRGDFTSRKTSRKDTAAFANGGIGSYDSSSVAGTLRLGGDIKGGGSTLVAMNNPSYGVYEETDIVGTITTENGHVKGGNPLIISQTTATIDTSYAKQYGCVNQHVDAGCPNFVLVENHRQDARYRETDVSPTLNAKMGTGGGNVPLCIHASQDTIVSDKHAHALGANSTQAVCIAENIINRADNAGGNGIGAQEEIAYTLNSTGVHCVAEGLSIRRLTPRECERLQAFPDDWTKFPYKGKDAEKCPDSPRYKGCGNAITVAVGSWVLKRLFEYSKSERQ